MKQIHEVDHEQFKRDWLAHISVADICERHELSKDRALKLRDVLELPKRHDRRLRARPQRQRDPTPTEIERLCKKIRASWDDETERDRRVSQPTPWELPVVDVPEGVGSDDEWDGRED